MLDADKHFHASEADLRANTVHICSEGWGYTPPLCWEETRDESGTLVNVRPEYPCYLKFTPKKNPSSDNLPTTAAHS